MKRFAISIAVIATLLTACMPMLGKEPATEANAIPAALQGRWGLNENDCDPARDDNKGLMVIEARTLKFYESRATLARVNSVEPTRIDGDFAFTGEGQSWNLRMTLEAQDAGMVLIRRDFGDDAMPGPLRYMNCEAV